MKYPAWIKPVAASLILLVGLIPVVLYLWTFGRVPQLDAGTALKMLNDPGRNAVLVDVRTRGDYAAMHIAGSHHWPASTIASLQSLEQIPEEFKRKRLLLICSSGFQSTQAAEKLRLLGLADVVSIRGGMQKWVGISHPGSSLPFTSIVYASSETPLSRPMTLFEQTAAVVSGFGIKPLHMFLSAVLGFILLKQRAVDLRMFGWAVIIFLAAETFCAINYLFYQHDSYLAEYLHSYGMTLAFGVAAFALIQGLDGRLFHFSEQEKRCVLLPLCKGCVKYNQVSCRMRSLFQLAAIALSVLALLPLAASPVPNSYVTTIFGTPYNYCRLLLNQYFEGRYLPTIALLLGSGALLVMRKDGKSAVPVLARILLAGAAGALGFGVFRLVLGSVFGNALIWADVWEEITELMFVAFAAAVIWIYRDGLLDVPIGREIFRREAAGLPTEK